MSAEEQERNERGEVQLAADEFCEIIETQRGGQKLTHNGFTYYKDKQSADICYWVCVCYREKDPGARCQARARTKVYNEGHVLLSTTEHSHLSSILNVETQRYRNNLKRKAKESSEKPEKIIRYCTARAPVEVQTQYSKVAQRRMCQRQRQKEYPNDPANYDEIDEEFTQTFDGQPFLLKNVVTDEGRIMIFSTIENITRLSQSPVLIMDGTFQISPSAFRQVFTIHGSVGQTTQKFLPFVHMFLPNKLQTSYTAALRLLKQIARDNQIRLKPKFVITDFESAEVNAIGIVFPHCVQYGCFFHLVKNMWKRMQKLGLTSTFHSQVNVQMAFKQTEALAFLKAEEVAEGFTAVRAAGPRQMDRFFNYFEKNYVGRLVVDEDGAQRRRKPKYSPKFWTSRDVTLMGIPRTTNAIEGYHNKINGLLRGVKEDKFYRVVKVFKEEEQSTTADYLRFLQGDLSQRARTDKFLKKEAKLKNTITAYEEGGESRLPLMDHIKAIALILVKK